MSSSVEVLCYECGKPKNFPRNEYNRKLRLGTKFFCSLQCCGANSNRSRKAKELVLTCKQCGTVFKSSTRLHAAKEFCSRSCASKGSMNEFRRAKQSEAGLISKGNLISSAEALKIREKWKYVLIEKLLEEKSVAYEFEYKLGSYVFDLALIDKNILIEFDGPEHLTPKVKENDLRKEEEATKAGFILIRRNVQPAEVINPRCILDLAN